MGLFGRNQKGNPLDELKNENTVLNEKLKKLQLLKKLSVILASDLSIEVSIQNAVDFMAKEMGFAGGNLFFESVVGKYLYANATTNNFLANAAQKLLPIKVGEIKYYLTETDNLIIKSYLSKEILISQSLADFAPKQIKPVASVIQKFANIRSVLALPLIYKDRVLGMVDILSHEDTFSEGDMEIIRAFGDFCAITINNSLAFDKINQQVELLAKQNHDLESLYNLTSRIGQTLDPAKVAQTGVDSLPQDKIMLGAILTNYNLEKNALEVKAVTQNPFSYEVQKIIGDFAKYSIDLKDPSVKQTLTVKAMDTGLPQYSDNLEEFLSPPIPKTFIPMISKVLQIKSAVVYPLMAKNRFIGTIAYLLKEKNYSELDENEKQLLSTYTYQITIALENANLYNHSQFMQLSLEKALKDLQAARKHEQDMIDIMGHELRTPMSVVRNALNMMDMAIKTQGSIPLDKQKRYVDMGLESARREVTLIETLLSATKTDSKGFQLLLEKVDLGDVVHDSLIAFKRETEKKGIDLQFENPEEPVFIYADRTRMQEIADNFISNALKYTEKGAITVRVTKDEKYGYLSVIDTGIGISEADLQKLGTKFFRAKQYTQEVSADSFEDNVEIIRPGGTGLGLYVTFNLIRLMDGTLEVKSVLGKGSTFVCGLPVYADQSTKQIEKKVLRDKNDQPF